MHLQCYRYLRNSHFCFTPHWPPSFSQQNVLLPLGTVFVFWLLSNAPSSFPTFRSLSFWMPYPELVLVPDSSCCSSSLQPSWCEWGCEPVLCDLERLSGCSGRRDSHIRNRNATWKGNSFCHVLLNQPVLWQAGDRLVSLDRKHFEKSELTIRKIPTSPDLVQEIFSTSILQSQHPHLEKNYALASTILILFWHNSVRVKVSGFN